MTEFNQREFSKLVRDAIALGQKCSRTAFPNPSREGCPNRSILRAMAHRDGRLTLTDIPVSHVLSCSPCFQDYQHLRRMSLVVWGVQVTTAFLIVLAILFVGVRLVWNYASGQGQPSISREQRAAPRPRLKMEQISPPETPLAISVNLASFSPTRGEDSKHLANKIHLPPKLLRVNFVLPVGMEPGEYMFRLKDSVGTVFVETPAQGRLSNGVTSIDMYLDLTAASRGNFSLMIRPPGLSWRTFPVLIS